MRRREETILGILYFISLVLSRHVGGAVASWLVHSSLIRAVRARALAGGIVLRSWARHLTLTVPLFAVAS